MPFPADSVFVDDTHKQRVATFWGKWLRAQGAALVTFQNGAASAMNGARERLRTPLSADVADPKAEAIMLKYVKVIEDRTAEAPRDKNAREEAREKIPDAPKPPAAKLDRHGNPAGAEHDLVADGALRSERILIVTFTAKTELDDSPLPSALSAKGCEVERTRAPLPPLAAWKEQLTRATQLWLFASKEPGLLPAGYLNAIVERWKAGHLALYIAGDNEPYIVEANALLKKIAPDAMLAGNDPGGAELHSTEGGAESVGFDAKSPLFHGINHIFEGSTVSSLRGAGFTSACTHTGGGTLLGTIDKPGCSRVVLDCGFTRWLAHYWDNAGAPRLAVNIAGWLASAKSGSPTAIGVK